MAGTLLQELQLPWWPGQLLNNKGAIQASARSKMFGYTNREYYEYIVTVSTERKLAWPKTQVLKESAPQRPLINAISQNKHYSSALILQGFQAGLWRVARQSSLQSNCSVLRRSIQALV